jgi:hypothetical protein
MALFTQAQAQGYIIDNQDDISPFVSVGNTPDNIQSPAPASASSLNLNMLSGEFAKDATPKSPYVLRLQSNRLHDNRSSISSDELKLLLKRDLNDRLTEMKPNLLAESLFPDEAFGFPVNEKFIENFYNSFLTNAGDLNEANFQNEDYAATFLNRMISTITHFLNSTKKITFKPLRYFSSAYSSKPLKGHPSKRKPDVILLPLINGYLRDISNTFWHDVQAMIEQTREKGPPQRLPDTVSTKSWMVFCSQTDRDFFICLCITGKGFYIVLTDHVGQIETDRIPFSNSLIFVRMVMGLAFLPDSFIGKDATITRSESGKASSDLFTTFYQPFHYRIPNPSINLMALSSCTPESSVSRDLASSSSTSVSPGEISTISVGSNNYKVVRTLFKSQTLIGRATTVYLVHLQDNRLGVIKDCWITKNRVEEANFLKGLNIPFGPKLIDHCVLRNTLSLRDHPVKSSLKSECREKRRVVTYPAGVHISDFTSHWELLVAFLDIVIGMKFDCFCLSCL